MFPSEVLVPSLNIALHDAIPDEELVTTRMVELKSLYMKGISIIRAHALVP